MEISEAAALVPNVGEKPNSVALFPSVTRISSLPDQRCDSKSSFLGLMRTDNDSRKVLGSGAEKMFRRGEDEVAWEGLGDRSGGEEGSSTLMGNGIDGSGSQKK